MGREIGPDSGELRVSRVVSPSSRLPVVYVPVKGVTGETKVGWGEVGETCRWLQSKNFVAGALILGGFQGTV